MLNYIKFASLGTCKVKVHHFGGVVTHKYQVVQIYIDTRKSQLKNEVENIYKEQISIDCFVSNEFTFHRLVPGMVDYIRENYTLSNHVLNNISEPDSMNISHGNINKGTAMILSNASKIKIMGNKCTNIRLEKVNLLLEQTIFGYSISGKVPEKLLPKTHNIENNKVVPVFAHDRNISTCVPCDEYFPGCQAGLSPEFDNRDNMVSLGDMRNRTCTGDEKAVKIAKEGIKFDEKAGQYLTPLSFDDKEIFLKTNEIQAGIRTHRDNEKMLRNDKDLIRETEAFSEMFDTESIERVIAEMASFDKQLRSCKTQTVNGVIIRPLKILYSLEINKSDICAREFHKERQNIIKENNPRKNMNELHTLNTDSGGVND